VAFDWSHLREPAPGTLAKAREVAHFAVQWAAKAARANLRAEPDDGHTALSWDAGLGALVSAPLPDGSKAGSRAGARVGLQLASLELIVTHRAGADHRTLDGCMPGAVDDWLDLKLAAQGLKPASAAQLPYEVPARKLKFEPELAALARWYAAADEALEEVRARYAAIRPGPGPVRCWPHHFDIALLVQLEPGSSETARSIGIGVSPGDGYYAQPYAYVSPYPAPRQPLLPALPPAGHWHEKDFFAAVATAEALLAQRDPRAALLAVIDSAFEAGKGWLDG
jgi:hypothetical protein